MFKKFLLMGVYLLAALAISHAQDEGEENKKQKQEKEPTFSVMEIAKSTKDLTYLVIEDAAVEAKKKEMDKAFESELKKWEKAKKDAAAKKEKFALPKPVKSKMKVVAKGLTKEKADEARAKAEAEFKKKQEKKGTVKKDNATEKIKKKDSRDR